IALSVGAGGGVASIWFTLKDSDSTAGGSAVGDVVVGKRFGSAFEVYLSNKVVWLVNVGYVIDAARAGVRLSAGHFHLGVEGGATFHHSFLVLGEATGYVGLHF